MSMILAVASEAPSPGILAGGSCGNLFSGEILDPSDWSEAALGVPLIDRLTRAVVVEVWHRLSSILDRL
jgi:hypothetical protein